MPKIVKFHSAIGVKDEDGGSTNVIRTDLPDFAPADEVLKLIGGAVNAKTAGEVIRALSERRLESIDCGVDSQCVDDGSIPVFGWDYNIG